MNGNYWSGDKYEKEQIDRILIHLENLPEPRTIDYKDFTELFGKIAPVEEEDGTQDERTCWYRWRARKRELLNKAWTSRGVPKQLFVHLRGESMEVSVDGDAAANASIRLIDLEIRSLKSRERQAYKMEEVTAYDLSSRKLLAQTRKSLTQARWSLIKKIDNLGLPEQARQKLIESINVKVRMDWEEEDYQSVFQFAGSGEKGAKGA